MILPDKHITIKSSLVNGGAVVLRELRQAQTVTTLWEKVGKQEAVGNFERFGLILSFLYTIGGVEYQDGLLVRTGDRGSKL